MILTIWFNPRLSLIIVHLWTMNHTHVSRDHQIVEALRNGTAIYRLKKKKRTERETAMLETTSKWLISQISEPHFISQIKLI